MDLTNDILADDIYDPSAIHSPLHSTLTPPSKSFPSDTLFGIARKLFTDVPFCYAAVDGYIDNILTAMLDTGNWKQKGTNTALFAVHTLFRPTSDSDPPPTSRCRMYPQTHGRRYAGQNKSYIRMGGQHPSILNIPTHGESKRVDPLHQSDYQK